MIGKGEYLRSGFLLRNQCTCFCNTIPTNLLGIVMRSWSECSTGAGEVREANALRFPRITVRIIHDAEGVREISIGIADEFYLKTGFLVSLLHGILLERET